MRRCPGFRASVPAVNLRGLRVLLVLAVASGLLLIDPQLFGICAPAIALFALLVAGVRPGERIIVALARARSRPRRPSLVVPRPALPIVVLRTGRLIAAALAVRPPPAAAVSP